MAALFDEFPRLRTREGRTLLRDLTNTLDTRPPKAGSVEALVLDWAGQCGGIDNYPGYDLFRWREAKDSNEPARQIALRGFEAIPELIALVGDRRITSREKWGRSPSMFRTGEMAACLLHEIVGHGVPGTPDGDDTKEWRAWWEQTRKVKERDYFHGAVFLKQGTTITQVNGTVAHIIASKWPEDIPGLCEQYTKCAGPNVRAFELAHALATARLPKNERVKELAAFAGRGLLEDRRIILQALAELDPKKAATILGPLLDKIPKDSGEKYWMSSESYFALVVLAINDRDIWNDYIRVAKRSSPGVQLQILNNIGFFPYGDKHRTQRLAFLAAFLDEQTVRDQSSAPEKYFGPSAASEFPKITVRDFAAMEIAEIIRLDDSPDPKWDAGQWAKFREKVRRKLADERVPKLGSGQ